MRLVIVEDEASLRGTVVDGMENAGVWAEGLAGFEDARRFLESVRRHPSAEIDAVLMDLKLSDREEEPVRGWLLAQEFRRAFPACWIAIYSSLIDLGKITGAEAERAASSAGADRVLRKHDLSRLPTEAILEEVRKGIAEKQERLASSLPLAWADDLESQAAQEAVGDNNVRRVIKEFYGNVRCASVRALSGGFSGAVVLAVRCERDGEGWVEGVLKLGSVRDGTVTLEWERQPVVGSTFSSAAPATARQVVRSGEWAGLLVAAVSNAVTLEQWLCRGPVAPEAADKVIGATITEPAKRAGLPVVGPPRLLFGYRDALAVVGHLSRVAGVVASEDAVVHKAVATTEALARGWSSQGGVLAMHSRGRVLQHGDLHARNVLVGADAEATPIDFARHQVFPRAFDAATLVVDLVLRVVDLGSEREWSPTAVPAWESEYVCAWPLPEIDATRSGSESKAILTFLSRLRRVMQVDLRVGESEFAECILFNVMRYLRFPDLSPAKRVLGCVWVVHLAERLGLDVVRNGAVPEN